ncbi:MAG TPA: GAF domain-containing protein [Clostridiales bacterium]|nr:GAF domain-containing protein [Clostridiales bacterium]
MNQETLYAIQNLEQNLLALSQGVSDPVSLFSNAAALLWQSLDNINWAGFYRLIGDELILYPFQGKPACTHIPLGKGVCGTAAAENRTIVVPDVHLFPGHIVCDEASRSEIVIPLRVNGTVHGVLDIDSPVLNRFTREDQKYLEGFTRTLEKSLN